MLAIGHGYYATEDGTIFSERSNRVLKAGIGTNGRPLVNIWTGERYQTRYVHVLVCTAYHGARPEGATVSHLNGDKLDNQPDNLAWETQTDNLARKRAHGTDDRGLKNSRAVLTPEKIVGIYLWRAEGASHNTIAKRLGVSRTTVSRVLNGRRYGGDTDEDAA